MTPFGYIGIDFGTSNSHFAYCNREGDLKAQPICVGGKTSVTTCVLWQQPAQEEQDIVAYGSEALETWLQYEAEERAGSYFAFGFKPDLVKSDRARRDAWAFLLKARQEVQRAGLPRPIESGGMAVIIGVPAEIGDEHKRLTVEAARAAGFGAVECVEEPLGALAFHLNNGDITPSEARAGVIVVDFGGGTFDVALVSADGLREPWGDPVLGGRLFDDLFYQWLCDQNPHLEIDDREALVVWQRECRDLKEAFSNRWRSRGDTMNDFKGHVFIGDAKVWLRNASVAEFYERARAYRPSPIARRYFRGLDQVPTGLVLDTPIDLLQWARRTLTRGQAVGELRGKFGKVILTGGSCHWPFMGPLVVETLAVDPGDIVLSQTPETTIGSGLAVYNVLKLRNEARRQKLRGDKPPAVEQFRVDIAKRLNRFAEDSADALLDVLMPRVEAVFWEWYNKGGSLKQVEDRIDAICKTFEENQEAEGILKPHWTILATDLVRLLRDHLRQFLAEHEIPSDVYRYIPESATLAVGTDGFGKDTGSRIAAEMMFLAAKVAAVGASIVAIVVAAVKIKLLLLLVFIHPILTILGGAVLLLGFLGVGKAAKEVVENQIKSYQFGPASLWVLHKVLWESRFKDKLAQGRTDARNELVRMIRETVQQGPAAPAGDAKPEASIAAVAIEKFGVILDLVIQDLGVLELVGSGRSRGSP
jgi:hypothetical protein